MRAVDHIFEAFSETGHTMKTRGIIGYPQNLNRGPRFYLYVPNHINKLRYFPISSLLIYSFFFDILS